MPSVHWGLHADPIHVCEPERDAHRPAIEEVRNVIIRIFFGFHGLQAHIRDAQVVPIRLCSDSVSKHISFAPQAQTQSQIARIGDAAQCAAGKHVGGCFGSCYMHACMRCK